jgi:hypothetical protein
VLSVSASEEDTVLSSPDTKAAPSLSSSLDRSTAGSCSEDSCAAAGIEFYGATQTAAHRSGDIGTYDAHDTAGK